MEEANPTQTERTPGPVPPVPTIGRIVHYRLSEIDAEQITRRREDARKAMADHIERANGTQVHVGNPVKEGDVYPMMIVAVWGGFSTSAVNGQVMLDGNDVLWVTSVQVGEGPRTFSWPSRS